jgi:tetratricopeptide (TPR) repeat protein
MIVEGEDHGTVALRGHYFALKKTFDDWRPSEKEVAEGMPALEEHYKRLSDKYHFKVEPPERLVRQIGFRLLKSGKSDEAIAVLKKNTERFPNSASAFAGLAHGFEGTGKLDLAKTNYERAIVLGIKRGDPSVAIYKIEAERVSKALKNRGANAEK